MRANVFRRLNLAEDELAADMEFQAAMFAWLTESQAGWDQFFHDWFGGAASAARAGETRNLRSTPTPALHLCAPAWRRAQKEVERVWFAISERDD